MKQNTFDNEQIKGEFKEWQKKNLKFLPLNYETWVVETFNKSSYNSKTSSSSLRKYSADVTPISAFYKPISRIIKLPFSNQQTDE